MRSQRRVRGKGRKRSDKAGQHNQGQTDQHTAAPPGGGPPTVSATREVRKLLEGIGTPGADIFKPDPFQLEALAALEFEDVLVTAPTGSGKTWIAREEIRRLLSAGRRAWYTTPLKALTNSKYQEFSDEFGAERVGILTGDRKENSDAPLIVGTTEIYRNQLFDSLRGGADVRTDLVTWTTHISRRGSRHVGGAIILTPLRISSSVVRQLSATPNEFAAGLQSCAA